MVENAGSEVRILTLSVTVAEIICISGFGGYIAIFGCRSMLQPLVELFPALRGRKPQTCVRISMLYLTVSEIHCISISGDDSHFRCRSLLESPIEILSSSSPWSKNLRMPLEF